ncbi:MULTISPECIES: hypothetical protein [unclassified Bradyrhizobium]|uniref:hypothetical protein n=1 Tax=Bradyrhizobium sp. USDA 4541 TaxID=2817704 RepID=UPI0020A34E50|nr:hypothetical protein [Bradyrhizobium sp. USDA 4541]MCP1849391.1 hypothetical protein [Bradyrhizobium sp. USDA 4541]
MARTRPRKRSAPGIGWAGVTGIMLLLLALSCGGAMAYIYLFAERPPVLDVQSLCPVSGPQGVTVVLVDTSDELPETTRREVLGLLDEIATTLPPFHRLDVRVLDIAGLSSRSIFSKCNPGDGAGLSEWTNNRELARKRWNDSFRKPVSEAIKNSVSPARANASPIMGAIQHIAIDEFAGNARQDVKKTLYVISDMIESTKDYSQYPRAGDLSYLRYKQSAGYLKYQTDLHGATVFVELVTRQLNGKPVVDDLQLMKFWQEWISDNRGKVGFIKRLQGA